MSAQLNLLAAPVKALTVEPTREVIFRGASADSVPRHSHLPAPMPKAIAGDDDWLLALMVAEEQIRWRSWPQPHPIPLDERPDSTGGRSAGDRWVDYGSKGVAVAASMVNMEYAPWKALLRGIGEQRRVEPHIADARDLAHAYSAVESYDRFYIRDGGSAVRGGRNEWRETVALPHFAKLKAIVVDLGGDPEAVTDL